MKCFHKMNNRAGFTLAETLLAVLILLLVSGIVATGVPVARNVYEKVVLTANANVMLSTAVDTLRSEIGTAWKVRVVDDKTVVFFSARTGWQSQIKVGGNAPIMITEYVDIKDGDLIFDAGTNKQEEHSLVPDKSSKMYVSCDKVDWSDIDDVIVFYDIQVKKKLDNSSVLVLDKETEQNRLEIRVVSGDVIK